MYVQLVFAVKNRYAVLEQDLWESGLEYISGIIASLKHKSLIIAGTSNHQNFKARYRGKGGVDVRRDIKLKSFKIIF